MRVAGFFVIQNKGYGSGISKQAQQLIFERFFQADNENTKQQIGSGLGLSISKSLVEEMGGYIELKSEEGAGSEFYFELRLIKPNPLQSELNPDQKETLPPEDAHKIRLLLFEDNELNKQLVRHLVKEAGFQLDVAVNGVDGIQLVKENTYDLILMDLDMPVMGMYHATDMIRNELKISTPIIAMTFPSAVNERGVCPLACVILSPNQYRSRRLLKKYSFIQNFNQQNRRLHLLR